MLRLLAITKRGAHLSPPHPLEEGGWGSEIVEIERAATDLFPVVRFSFATHEETAYNSVWMRSMI